MSVDDVLAEARERRGPIVVLTGAGISAESGIPTFRGPDGYWQIGSRNYRPQELATAAAFARMPAAVWGWYLYRRGVCLAAAPNAAHRALAVLERDRGDDFLLVTQNVDGLHLRVGHAADRVWEVHGNLHFLRCQRECSPTRFPLPAGLPAAWPKGRVPTAGELDQLRCPGCGGPGRPHVLWFDECYDEARYRSDSALLVARAAALLWIVGTSGATTLPARMAEIARSRGVPILVADLEPGTFGELAASAGTGAFVRGPAASTVPPLVERLRVPR